VYTPQFAKRALGGFGFTLCMGGPDVLQQAFPSARRIQAWLFTMWWLGFRLGMGSFHFFCILVESVNLIDTDRRCGVVS
jgi:hypothetical protein